MSKSPEQPANKAPLECNYRPFIELECKLCHNLFDMYEISPMAIADVGARGDTDPFWSVFAANSTALFFEPEQQESERLKNRVKLSTNSRDVREIFFPVALGRESGTQKLYVTQDPSNSSLYAPNMDFFNRLPDQSTMKVVATQTVQTETLDACLAQADHQALDVLKMDTQGSELDILRGAEQTIAEGLLAVVAEVAFVELYQGEPLFADVDIFMRQRGFTCIDLDIRRWRRRSLPACYDGMRVGQTIYADVVYLKDPIGAPAKFAPQSVWRDKLLKLIALAERFSVPDYAMEIAEFARREGIIGTVEEAAIVALLHDNRITRYNDRRLLAPHFSSPRPFIPPKRSHRT